MSDKVTYVLEVDDKGSPKLLKMGANAEKAGKQAEKSFSGAKKAVGDFAGQLPVASGAMSTFAMGPAAAAGVAVGALAAGFGVMVKKSIDFADNMNDLSLRLGISTERLSVLSLYAEQSGTDIETLASAMGKLGVKLSSGDKDLKSYGITAGTVDEALFQLADKVKNTEDPMLRLKIATDAFGKSGQQMLPMLVQGGDALREMSETAPVVTKEMAAMSDQFNDSMADLKGSFASIGLEIATGLLPYLQSAANLMKEVMASVKGGEGKLASGAKNWSDEAASIRAELSGPDVSRWQRIKLESRLKEAEANARAYESAAINARIGAGGPGGMGGYRGEDKSAPPMPKTRPDAPPASSTKPIATSVDYWSANGYDQGEYQYTYNNARKSNFALSGIGEDRDEAQSVDLGGFDTRGPDYYAGLPVSEKAKASMEAQYDEEREAESKKLEERRAEMASFYAGVTGDMKGAFSSAYADIWKNGRDAASALYDAFSECFTDRLIDSLASLSANGLMSLLTGGGSTAGQGVFSLLGFAGGGAPPVGSPSIVGERRAEMIIPRGPSRVEPTSGRGDVYNITVSNPAEARSLVRSLKTDERRRNTGVR